MTPTPKITWLDCRHSFLKCGKIWLHALHENEVVGQLSILPVERQWALVGDLFVVPKLRGLGVAAALIDDAEAGVRNTREMKLLGMAAKIRCDNAGCLALFKRRGYVHVWSEGEVLLLSKRIERKETA